MSLKNETLFDKGDVASIYEETLSDGSKVYNLRVYDCLEDHKYVEIQAVNDKHAIKIFEVLNSSLA